MTKRTVIALLWIGSLLQMNAQQPSSPSQQPANPPEQTAARPKSNPIPDSFVNLLVLPKDITKKELVGVMKNFAVTFSVRCSYCHAVSDDLTEGRFDTDEKDPKGKARDLLRAIQAVSNARVPASSGAKQ